MKYPLNILLGNILITSDDCLVIRYNINCILNVNFKQLTSLYTVVVLYI